MVFGNILSIREQRRLQQMTLPMLPKSVFKRHVQAMFPNLRSTKGAIEALQESACAYAHELFQNANTLARNTSRYTLQSKDIDTLKSIRSVRVRNTKRRAIPKAAFARIFREIVEERKSGLRISPACIAVAHKAGEDFVAKRFAVMSKVALLAGRKTAMLKDARTTDQLARHGVDESVNLV